MTDYHEPDEVEVFDEETDTEEEHGGGEGNVDIDYEAEAKRKTEMVDYLKRDIHDERKRRQALEARLKELEAHQAQASLATIDQEIVQAKAHFKRMFDEGDGEQVAAAQEKLTELVSQRALLKNAPKPQPTEAPAQLAPEAEAWISRNKWFKQGGGDDLSKRAIDISIELEQAGYDRNSPDLYRELDKRLEAHKPKKQPNAAPVHRGGGRDGAGNPRRLTEMDKATMKMFGYNPNDAKHRETWLKRNDPLE